MSNKRFGCIGIALFLLLCLSGLVNLILIAGRSNKFTGGRVVSHELPEFGETMVESASGASTDKIALIGLRGLISSSVSGSLGETMVDDIKIALRQAVDDDRVKAIVLNIDSPGGEVTASDVIYNAVKNARAKKPVVIYMGSLAASGGYYISCGGSWLIANETTLTGSIGVIMETVNYKDLMGKIGVSPVVFKSGKFKDMMSGSRDMTDEEKDYIQNMIKETYGKFVKIVADERKLPEQGLRDGIADGRVISGKDALDDKLINQLGQIEDAFAKARELGNAPGAAVVRYQPGFKLGKLLQMLGQSEQSKIEINLAQKVLPPLESGRFYMLPSFYAQ
ncbi:MAG: signal peptide peptidase SppA [Chthoniobacteraceae bacterium]